MHADIAAVLQRKLSGKISCTCNFFSSWLWVSCVEDYPGGGGGVRSQPSLHSIPVQESKTPFIKKDISFKSTVVLMTF